ncbi:hypothetical protein [Ferrovibrio terrae]|uniref:hypothetical protein n=1 Tax=Ferrovibrio terrae TaxID=2594003 RepID=UPI003137B48C
MVYIPSASRREQQALLDSARDRLKAGDIDGYWSTLKKQDPYAGLAGDAAANRGELGQSANARLERFARDLRGKPLTEAERDEIRNAVAAADLAQRDRNLQEQGNHRITGQQSVDYHAQVFEARGIPKEAYFPTELQPDFGGSWGLLAGIRLPDARVPTGLPSDEIKEWAQKDWKPVSDQRLRDTIIEASKHLPQQGLMEIEGFHGDPQQPASFAERLATLPPPPRRWLEFTLQKQPGDLSARDLHALQASDAYLKPQHPRHDETFKLVSDTYRHLYGDAPQETDATGRPQRGAPRQSLPDSSAQGPDERRRREDLAGLGTQLDRWHDKLGGGEDAWGRVTGWLQRGLNDLLWPGKRVPDADEAARKPYRSGPILVDGDLGPVTADALDQAQANFGLASLQQGIGRIAAADEGWAAAPRNDPWPEPDEGPIFYAP